MFDLEFSILATGAAVSSISIAIRRTCQEASAPAPAKF